MILFAGDSFTWGQGLHYYYMIENQGWSWEDCRNFINNSNNNFLSLGFAADEFRKKNNFTYLVGENLDIPTSCIRLENGGDNRVIYNMIKNLFGGYITDTNIDCIIVQFSAPTRTLENGTDRLDDFNNINEFLNFQINRIDQFCKTRKIKWFGISWFTEMGDVLKERYPDNFIPILYNDKEYESFDFEKHLPLRNLTIQYTENIDDGHLNLDGHKVVAKSITDKIKSVIL